MNTTKVAITLDRALLRRLDRLVAEGRYTNRSRAIQDPVRRQIERVRRRSLAEEAAKLDPREERALAEEGWPARHGPRKKDGRPSFAGAR